MVLKCNVRVHRAVTAKVIPFSKTVTILVGEKSQPVVVHRDLLMIHSVHSGNKLKRLHEEEDLEIIFPMDTVKTSITPSAIASLFADFVSWIYTGNFMDVLNEAFGGGQRGDELWELGGLLGVPAFQNLCVDDSRVYCPNNKNLLPFIAGVETMYRCGRDGSRLWKLATNSIACKNPLDAHARSSKEHKEWMALLTRIPELSIDMRSAKKYNGSFPQDDEHRARYIEPEEPLEKLWDDHILSKGKTQAEIREAAKSKSLRNIVGWDHLGRKKVR